MSLSDHTPHAEIQPPLKLGGILFGLAIAVVLIGLLALEAFNIFAADIERNFKDNGGFKDEVQF